jgi:hypothetical protein
MRAPNTSTFTAALAYAGVRGWYVFPANISDGEKKSHKSAEFSEGRKWGMTKDSKEIERDFKRWPDAIGIPTGAVNGIFVVEIDTPVGHGVDGLASLRALEAKYGPLPATLMAESPSGSIHYYFIHPGGDIKIPNSTNDLGTGIDVRGDGGMVIAPPSLRKDGLYRWLNDLQLAIAPPWLIELVKEKDRPTSSASSGSDGEPKAPLPLYKVLAAFAVIPNDDFGWEEWNKRGMAIYATTDGSADGLTVFDIWSKKSRKYSATGTTDKWDNYHTTPPDEIGGGSIVYWANEACPRWEVLAYERPGMSIAAQMTEIMEIVRLARLPYMQYERERKESAKRLNARTSKLDDLVQSLRPPVKDNDDGLQGGAVTFAEPDPWPDPVDGAQLLNMIAYAVRRYVVLNKHGIHICALWAVHSYLTEYFTISPKLFIHSAVKGCGKTTLLDVLSRLVKRAMTSQSITPAAVFRIIAMYQPTLLIDELDTFLRDNNELRGVLNASHRYDGVVHRIVGEDLEPREFKVYTAVALAQIGSLPPTLIDRSITVDLKRRRAKEKVESFRINKTKHLDDISRRIVRWVNDHGARLAGAEPDMPAVIINRMADNWLCLLAIADAIGGRWPARARAAALQAHADIVKDEGDSLLELLLRHIRDVFDELKVDREVDHDRIWSDPLADKLAAIVPSPWAEYGKNGKPITANTLARLLKKLKMGIAPQKIGSVKRPARGITAISLKKLGRAFWAPRPVLQSRNRRRCFMHRGQHHYAPGRPPGMLCPKPPQQGLCNRNTATNPYNTGTFDLFPTATGNNNVAVANRQKTQ